MGLGVGIEALNSVWWTFQTSHQRTLHSLFVILHLGNKHCVGIQAAPGELVARCEMTKRVCLGGAWLAARLFGSSAVWAVVCAVAAVAEGAYVIKCQFQSKRALRYIRLQLFPSTLR